MADQIAATFEGCLEIFEAEMVSAQKEGEVHLRASNSASFKAFQKDSAKATALARHIFETRHDLIRPVDGRLVHEADNWRGFAAFFGLMRLNLDLTPDELLDWMLLIKADPLKKVTVAGIDFGPDVADWPIGPMVQMIERKAKKSPLSATALAKLSQVQTWPEMNDSVGYSWGPAFRKIRQRIEDLLGANADTAPPVQPYGDLSGDNFGDPLEAKFASLDPETRQKWTRLFNQAAMAGASKPGKEFLEQAQRLKDELGHDWVRTCLNDWMARAAATEPREWEAKKSASGIDYTETIRIDFTEANVTLLKGIVWMCQGYDDPETIDNAAALCERALKRASQYTTSPQPIATACLIYFQATPSPDTRARLEHLKKVTTNKTILKRISEILA